MNGIGIFDQSYASILLAEERVQGCKILLRVWAGTRPSPESWRLWYEKE